ncbi:MAG TPA: hypothetical protein RMH99_03600 [Sandaracinaceae bacterium LLY-WYZ-13_1]|nr:hypothetical protein [Sandaracinaceae bacterium LLY-WYZ-13_1]
MPRRVTSRQRRRQPEPQRPEPNAEPTVEDVARGHAEQRFGGERLCGRDATGAIEHRRSRRRDAVKHHVHGRGVQVAVDTVQLDEAQRRTGADVRRARSAWSCSQLAEELVDATRLSISSRLKPAAEATSGPTPSGSSPTSGKSSAATTNAGDGWVVGQAAKEE